MRRGNANRATPAVARKLVAYLLAVDRGQTHFLVVDREAGVTAETSQEGTHFFSARLAGSAVSRLGGRA